MITERENLTEDVNESGTENSKTSDLIYAAQTEVKRLQKEVEDLQNAIGSHINNINTLLIKIKNTLNLLFTNVNLGELSNFKDHYYNVFIDDIIDDNFFGWSSK